MLCAGNFMLCVDRMHTNSSISYYISLKKSHVSSLKRIARNRNESVTHFINILRNINIIIDEY
jgi:hypothetical protein